MVFMRCYSFLFFSSVLLGFYGGLLDFDEVLLSFYDVLLGLYVYRIL